jgi:hypothetical protein
MCKREQERARYQLSPSYREKRLNKNELGVPKETPKNAKGD